MEQEVGATIPLWHGDGPRFLFSLATWTWCGPGAAVKITAAEMYKKREVQKKHLISLNLAMHEKASPCYALFLLSIASMELQSK